MNLATSRNLTTNETIRALDASLDHQLSEDVREALISNLTENADALIDARSQIETLKMRLKSAYFELDQVNAQLERVKVSLFRAVLVKKGRGLMS